MMTDFFPLFSRQSLKYCELILKLKTTKLRAAQRPFVCLGSPPPPSQKTDSLLRNWGASSHVSQRRLAEPHRGTKWQQISNKIHLFFSIPSPLLSEKSKPRRQSLENGPVSRKAGVEPSRRPPPDSGGSRFPQPSQVRARSCPVGRKREESHYGRSGRVFELVQSVLSSIFFSFCFPLSSAGWLNRQSASNYASPDETFKSD